MPQAISAVNQDAPYKMHEKDIIKFNE